MHFSLYVYKFVHVCALRMHMRTYVYVCAHSRYTSIKITTHIHPKTHKRARALPNRRKIRNQHFSETNSSKCFKNLVESTKTLDLATK